MRYTASILVAAWFAATPSWASPYYIYAEASASGNGVPVFDREIVSISNGPTSATASADLVYTFANCCVITASAAASTNLATGELKAYATGNQNVTYGRGYARASFGDRLFFDIPGGSDATRTFVTLTFESDGVIDDSARPASVQHLLRGFLDQLNPTITGSRAAAFNGNYSHRRVESFHSGWTDFDEIIVTPERFLFKGTFELQGTSPIVDLDLDLIVFAAQGGLADFLNTATIDLSLPTGVTFTSASGVFLTEAPGGDPGGTPVPEPAALGLLGLGALALGWRRRAA